MIDREVAAAGAEALLVAIGEIMEDSSMEAVTSARSLKEYRGRSQRLGTVGDDIATLAAAMEVLIRRSTATFR
jgi:hypothetical protein